MEVKKSLFRSIASNTLFQLVSKVITMTITFGLTFLISRDYGSYGYGLFTIFQSFPAVFYIISDFGLNAIGAREVSKNFKEINKIFNNILAIRILISMVLIIVTILLSLLVYPDTNIRFGLALGSFIIVSQALVSTTNIIFQVKLRYDLASITNVISYLFLLVVCLVLLNFKADISIINLMYVLASFLTFILNVYLLRKFDISLDLKFSKEYFKDLLTASWPLGLMFIFSQINFKADSILLSVMNLPNLGLSNIQTVGVYGLPYKVFEVLLVLPTFIMNSTYPVLLDSYNLNLTRFKKEFKKLLLYMFIIGIAVSFIGYVFVDRFLSYEIINTYFSTDFGYSKELLLILISGISVFFISQPLSWFLVIREKQKVLPFIYLVSAIFNVGMNYLLIPYFSFFASAYLTFISEILILSILSIYCYRFWPKNA
jgi:O-antigen/teichoic acid export membrane protein